MIIILEGPDGGGKTTLARKLGMQGFTVVKTNAPKPGENVIKSYLTSLITALYARPVDTVFDRHYLGECIYGPLLRGEDRLGDEGRAAIESIISSYGVKTVICLPPWDALELGWRSKDDLLTSSDQLRAVAARYVREAERLKIPIYDWTKGEDLCLDRL